MDRIALNQVRQQVLSRFPIEATLSKAQIYAKLAPIERPSIDVVLQELSDEKQLHEERHGKLTRVRDSRMVPALHKDYAVGTRVAFKLSENSPALSGRIDGICFQHLYYTYMVTVDQPLADPEYANWRVVPVLGTMIVLEL